MPSGDRITAASRKRKKVVRKKGAAEVEQAAKQVQAFVKRPVKIKAEPKVREVKKIAAVKIARQGEQQARKLPVATPRSKQERDSMVSAVANRQTTPRNKSAAAAIDALNERTTQRIALSSPKRAQQIVVKDAIRGVMTDVNRGVQSRGTPVVGKARSKAIEDLTSGKTRRIKSVGPFTRKQLEDEGAVKRSTTNSQLPSALRKVRYNKPATTPITKAIEKGAKRADPGALKLLDLAARPFYAGASAAKAAAEGKDVLAGAKRGVTGKEKASYRDVLKKAGAPKIVSDIVGTGADFILDPVNLVSAGSASTARKAGEKAAKSAAKKGLADSAVRKARLTAMRAVEDSGKNRVGLDLKVAGKSVPGVRKVVSKKVRDSGRGRGAANAVNPRARPKGVRESDQIMLREASTAARGFRDEALNETRRISRSAGKNVTKKDTPRILDAIERRDFTGLSADHAVIAKRVDDHMKKWAKRRKDAGLDAEITTGYVPHMTPASLRADAKPAAQGGSAFSKTVTDHSRKDKRTIREQNDEFAQAGLGKKFEDEDLPLLLAAQGAKSANTVAKAKFNQQIARDAPSFKAGENLRPGEGVYHFDQGTLRKLDADDMIAVSKGKHADKQLVRLNDEAYQRFVDDLKPLDRSGAGVSFDKANAAWKRLALATPGFYVRNLIGEATMGYMGTTGARGTARYVKAGAVDSRRVLKRVHKREMSQLDALDPKKVPLPRSTDSIKVAGKKQNLDDFIDEATAAGVLRKGQQGNELRELQDGLGEAVSVQRTGKRAVRTRERAHSFAADIEDIWRLASYKANLDSGMSKTEAARKSLDFHFDYGELSRFERQARRVLPFYTFNARALEMYARSALTNPKKLSAIEKARETVKDTTGADEGYGKDAKEYQLRQVPIVARIAGEDTMLQAGLPVGLLNEFPVDALEAMGKLVTGDVKGAAEAAKDQSTEWFLFAMGLLTPFAKAPIELGANHSYFFRGDIEPEGRRLVAAPAYLKPLMGTAVGDLMGLAMIKDKRTGNMTLGFRGKADYLIRQIPGIPAILNRLIASGTNRRGQDQTQELIAALTGINPDPVDPVGASFERIYKERDRIDGRMGDLRQQDKTDTAEYESLQQRKRELDDEIGAAKVERGDVVESKPKKRVRKRKQGAGFSFGGGSSSSSSPSSSSGSSSGFTFGG